MSDPADEAEVESIVLGFGVGFRRLPLPTPEEAAAELADALAHPAINTFDVEHEEALAMDVAGRWRRR